MNKLFFPLLPVLLLSVSGVRAQKQDSLMAQARLHAANLAGDEMFGRGYQKNGHLIAAQYIEETFKQYGLFPADANNIETGHPYFQKFTFAINLVDSMSLSVDGKALIPGADFIAEESSGSGKAVARAVRDGGYGLPDDLTKLKMKKGDIIVVREGLPEHINADEELKKKYKEWGADAVKIDLARKRGAGAIYILKKKLTASFSNIRNDIPAFFVREEAWPKTRVKKSTFRLLTRTTSVKSQNVIGMVRGKTFPDSVIIVSAHYDHLGMQGEAVFPGANDNASGTAVMLDLAGYYAQKRNQPAYSMLFIAFGAEECGLVGSQHYVRSPLVPLANTKFILNLDLLGNGDEGITAVAGLDYPDLFAKLQSLNDSLKAVPLVKGRKNAPNSDHYPFVEKGVKGMFIYTMGGPPHYHDVNDKSDVLLFSKYKELRELFIGFLNAIQ